MALLEVSRNRLPALKTPEDAKRFGACFPQRFSRRLATLAAASVAVVALVFSCGWAWGDSTAGTKTCQGDLENGVIHFRLTLDHGAVVARSLENRLTGRKITLPTDEFLLESKSGTMIRSSQCSGRVSSSSRHDLEVIYTSDPSVLPGLEVRVRYCLPGEKPYLRKQIALRQNPGAELRLMRVDLENWKGVPADWDSMRADRNRFGSHPIYCEDLWLGVEFVAAFNEYGKEGVVLRSRPGGKLLGGEWLELHSTVVGVAKKGLVREAFLDYIEDIRLAPPRMVWCYNSWWTLPLRFTEEQLLALTKELKDRLFDRHGVFFDVLAADEGWTNPQSVWEIDPREFPKGFASLRTMVESAGGKLGLWMSPSSTYPRSLDYKWAERDGLAVVKPSRWDGRTGASLADPKYRRLTAEQLRKLVREERFAHIKFDGFIAAEEVPHHELLPGVDSVEPLALYAMELIAATKQADPGLVTEPTFLNSLTNYISPWIIRHADTVWANAGGDDPLAIGPAPDYRESCTNSREAYIFDSLNEIWLPQNALQYFDIVHCDQAAGFANHVAMAVARGRFFVPAYVNPKYMNDEDFSVLAGLMRWAHAHQDILRQTVVLPSRVEQGEPYAYAHWLGKHGIVAVRNPSNESRQYLLDLRAAGAPADLAQGVVYSQYPYRKGLAGAVDVAAVVPVPLGPWELVFLEITPRAELREPVALGARWYRDPAGKMRVLPEPGVKRVEVLQPGGSLKAHAVAKTPSRVPTGTVRSCTASELPKADWLSSGGKPFPTSRFEVDCSAAIPAGTQGKVLLLVESSSRVHMPSTCTATVDGRQVHLEESSSAGHIRAGLTRHASEWTWYLCPVEAGESQIRFTGKTAMPKVKIGVWAWVDFDGSVAEQPLDIPCSNPEMPQVRDHWQRQGICLRRPSGQ